MNKSVAILLAIVGVALIAIGGAVFANAESSSWATEVGNFWNNGQISDAEFLNAVQFLVDRGYVKVVPQIVEVEIIKEVKADDDYEGSNELWTAIGALQDRDEKLQWDINNQMIGPIQYDELGNFIGAHELRIIELEAELHDLKLQLYCVIESNAEADCSKGGMTDPR